MNDKPKSIWKKSWTGLRAWLVVAAATFFAVLIVTLLIPGGFRNFSWWPALIFMLVVSVVSAACLGLLAFMRCFFCWRNFKRLLFVMACFVTLIALFYAEEDWRGWHAWNKFKQELEAKGEKFDLASVVPPPVPNDQNFAMTPVLVESIKAILGPERMCQWKYPDDGRINFIDRMPIPWRYNDSTDSPTNGDWARGTITDLKLWQAYYRAPAPTNRSSTITTNEFPIAPRPQTPAEDVLLALSKYGPAIEELRQASRLPFSRFPLDYDSENPAGIWLPHLALLKRSAQVLELRAIAESQIGQSQKASDDVKLMLRLTDAVRTEPISISHLVRIAMLQITLQPVYEGLAEHRWSDAQLVALDAELAKMDFLADYEFSQRGELGFMPSVLAYPRRTRDPEFWYIFVSGNYPGHSLEVELPMLIYRHCPGGWFYQNQLRYCRFALQNFLPTLDASRQLAFPASASRANAALQEQLAHSNPYNYLERKIVFDFNGEFAPDRLVEKFTFAQSSVDLARVAIALERYRLAHGEYPETLDTLAPQFIAKLPHDIINGQPLHYRRTADGQFVLYSVGWNETDDGGVVGLTTNGENVDNRKGDWVWRYPAR